MRKLVLACLVGILPVSGMAAPAYRFNQLVSGLVVSQPATTPSSPTTPSETVSSRTLETSTSSISFSQVELGSQDVKGLLLQNTGTQAVTLNSIETSSSDFVARTDCGASLGVGQTCAVNVTFNPSVEGYQSATLTIRSTDSNSPKTVSLSGSAVVAKGVLSAITASSFGNVTVGSSRDLEFRFLNTGGAPARGVYASLTAFSGLSLVSSNCGTFGAPVTVPAGGSCFMTVRWSPSVASSVQGAELSVSGAFQPGVVTQALSGTAGSFNATSVWSTSAGSTVSVTTQSGDFGTMTTGKSLEKTFYVRNTGTNGSQALSFRLQGDTDAFKITSVTAVQTSGGGGFYCSYPGNYLSTGVCTANDVNGGNAPVIRVTVRYDALQKGAKQATLLASTDNGTVLPAPLALKGAGEFNPQSVWSASAGSTTSITSAAADFGVITTGKTVTKYYYLRNVGTYGGQSAGVQLTGDTDAFKIVSTAKVNTGGGGGAYCSSTGVYTTTSPCAAEDISGGTNTVIRVEVKYSAVAVAKHSAQLSTTSSSNGTVLPADVITLTGEGRFDAESAWSTSASTLSAPTTAQKTFASTSVGGYAEKTFYLRNLGNYGGQSVAFSLTGDTAHFKLYSTAYVTTGGGGGGYCSYNYEATSFPTCTATENSGSAPVIRVVLRYRPTASGSHSASVVLTSSNGTKVPLPFTLTGSAP